MRAGWVAMALAALFKVEPAYPGQCSDLQPAQGKLGYQERSSPDRCEGIYKSLVAGEIELLSFLARPLSFDPQTDSPVIITASRNAAHVGSTISVVGRALPLRVYYRLDVDVGVGNSLKWPISEVVAPAGLSAADLGMVGWTLSSNERVLIPLDVYVEGTKTQPYPHPMITFRAPFDLDTFLWRIVDETGPGAWNKISQNTTIRLGDAVVFAVDGPTGQIVKLEVAAKPAAGDWIRTRTLVFLP